MSNQSCKEPLTKRFRGVRRTPRGFAPAVLMAGCLLIAGCSGTVIRQGHLFQEEDISQVKAGMPKDQVILALGTPDTQSAASGSASFYYISQTSNQPMAFMKPEVVDRRIVAVYFDKKDRVTQIANYGMKDGKVFDFVTRTTPTYTRDQGLLNELFRNIGAAPAIPGMSGNKSGPGN
jgi:outer membrane protein assembly factor BamE (lipoprotein component of BamABCDE complex)